MTPGENPCQVELDEEYVVQNFHKIFVNFMKDEGNVEAFSDLSGPVKMAPDEDQSVVKYLVKEIFFRFYFQRRVNEVRLQAVKLKEDGSTYDKVQDIVVDQVWLRQHIEPLQMEVEFDTKQSHLLTELNTAENCPCILEKFHEADNHNDACFRFSSWQLTEEDFFSFERDERQIHGLRWNESTTCWEGLFRTPLHKYGKGQTLRLENDWVDENFEEDFLSSLKEEGQRKRMFNKIPPGNARSEPAIVPDSLIDPAAPKICFHQDMNKTCVTDSLASALFFLGELGLAGDVHKYGRSITNNGEYPVISHLGLVRSFMSQKGHSWTPHLIDSRRTDLCDPFEMSNFPKLVVLEGTDGDTGHAVCVVDNWIFDSSLKFALPLTREALNFCCGDDDEFQSICKGYVFCPRSHLQSRFLKAIIPQCLIAEDAPEAMFHSNIASKRVTSALASGLWFFGDLDLAQKVNQFRVPSKASAKDGMLKAIISVSQFMQMQGTQWTPHVTSSTSDLVSDEDETKCPKLFWLESSVISKGFFACMVQKWIFLGGYGLAIPRNMDMLERLCGVEQRLIKIKKGYCFHKPKQVRKRGRIMKPADHTERKNKK
jgi:hypothetical protein